MLQPCISPRRRVSLSRLPKRRKARVHHTWLEDARSRAAGGWLCRACRERRTKCTAWVRRRFEICEMFGRAGRADVTDVVAPHGRFTVPCGCALGTRERSRLDRSVGITPSVRVHRLVHRRPRRDGSPEKDLLRAILPRRLDGALRHASDVRGRHSEEHTRRDHPASLRPPLV